MMRSLTGKLTLVLTLALVPALALAGPPEASSTQKEMDGLVSSCEASADARASRHAAKSLYERLGGYDKIHALTTEIVRRHKENPAIKQMFAHVNGEKLAKHVADFMSAGTGGTAQYTGRDMPTAHRHLKLTDADFLAAGGDIVGAMQGLGYGQEEIDEVVCILVSLKDQVVLKK